MSTLVVVGHLTTGGGEARRKVLDGLTKIMAYSQEREPGVLKYAITVPQDAQDEKSIYVIEEYADKAALDSHMQIPPIATFTQFVSSDPTLLEGAPVVYSLETVSSFTRAEIVQHADPYVVFATLGYKEGTMQQALEGWESLVASVKQQEPGTLYYGIMKDKDNAAKLQAVEVYESGNAFRQVHAKGEALTAKFKRDSDISTGVQLVFLKLAAGYFWKDKQSSSL
ncbi:hypothetical protein H2199_007360 [Coniosporium tulheliwenetii]|uniref:Uncharacterized protein n=1 Tax=Coniosporium tulheliwenetii TaxID=3383036 RepID=A0ACC2YRG5_9PEZI|nr:hypothetical protein H2199_007360 [Cladosporium sp. JES 115]